MSAPSMGHLSGVVRDEQDATLGDVLDTVHLRAEVLAVEHRDRAEGVLRPLRVEAERVDAGGAERERDARQALVEGLAEEPLERVVDALLGGAQQPAQQAGTATGGGFEAGERA